MLLYPLARDAPHQGSNLSLLLSPALAGMFFTTTVTWEASSIGTKVLYLVQILKNFYKDSVIIEKEKFELRKVKCKIIFIERIYRKSKKIMTFKFCDGPG